MPGNRLVNREPSLRASRYTGPLRCSRKIARATTSRGASSASRCWPFMKRTPRELTRIAPSPRTASEMSASGFSRRVERGRMELHELHVRERHAGAMGDREAVARRDDRIRRVTIDLAAAARGQHRRVGDDLGRPARDARAHAETAVASHDQVEHARLLEHADALRLAHPRDERARDLRTRLIAVRMNDPVLRVRRLASELELAPRDRGRSARRRSAARARVPGLPRRAPARPPRRTAPHRRRACPVGAASANRRRRVRPRSRPARMRSRCRTASAW